ncbi:hypothetical protein BKA56DRAFT_735697 [Ilyonectria sp. MPI-CAGE-AT-0026]|nr:hypothetical protein BKA56DRAFT_735697 [Ilyonectria sp. MPI-CAGE-AT-0026]
MDYPAELYEKLAHFAREHHRDKFNATAMLFAVQLWVDIVEHPDRMVEPFSVRNPEAPELPHVSLAVFLVYFETWLKFHEHLRCIQYIHPFRVMNTMYLRDIAVDTRAFEVGQYTLDEEAIRSLVLQGVSRRAGFPVITRVGYFPYLMNGTSMAAPQDLLYPPFSPTEQALIGMPSISILGLPSLHRQEGQKRLIAMPASIARLSFHGLTTPVMERSPANFQHVDVVGMTSQFGQLSTSGTIWAHDFMPDGDVTTIRERIWATDSAMNPSLPLSYFLNRNMEGPWMRRQRRRREWLIHLGATDIRELTVGVDGMLGFRGMPLEDEAHHIPPSALPNIMALASMDPCNRAALPEPLVVPGTLRGIISTIAGRPNLAHVAWSRAAPQLQEMATDLEDTLPTVRKVLKVLKSAKSRYWLDWELLNDLVKQTETDIGVLLGRDSSPRSWIGQAMDRMVGEHADPEPSRNWWPNHEETGNRIEENSPDAFASIDLVIDQLIRVERLRDSGNVEGAKSVARGVLLFVKTFLGLQQNGPFMVLIEEHIKDLEDYARSKGYEV